MSNAFRVEVPLADIDRVVVLLKDDSAGSATRHQARRTGFKQCKGKIYGAATSQGAHLGVAGGGAGKPAGGEVIRASGERYPLRKGILAVGKDDVLVILSGGGGHGPASERGADRLNADVLEGYVTVEGALSDYGMELKSGADEGQET